MLKYLFCTVILLIILLVLFRYYYKFSRDTSIEHVNSNDAIFHKNTWNNYMIGCVTITPDKLNTYDKIISDIIKRIETWEINQVWYVNYKIKGIIEQKKKSDFFNILNTTTPPMINNHLLPFKIVFSKKRHQLEFALNHFYCDGKILHDFIIHVVLNCNDNSVIFLKYKYIPVISDGYLLYYIFKQGLKLLTYNRDGLSVGDKSYIIRKKIYTNELEKVNRWTVLGKIMHILFNYITKSSLRVVFTIGIDDTTKYLKNRIGGIILDIPKMQIAKDYEDFLKLHLMKNKHDAMASYDLLRNFPTKKLRSNVNNNIDLVLTCFKINNNDSLNYINYEIGTIYGKGVLPMYILAATMPNYINVCIKSTTNDFNKDKFLKDENNSQLHHTWN